MMQDAIMNNESNDAATTIINDAPLNNNVVLDCTETTTTTTTTSENQCTTTTATAAATTTTTVVLSTTNHEDIITDSAVNNNITPENVLTDDNVISSSPKTEQPPIATDSSETPLTTDVSHLTTPTITTTEINMTPNNPSTNNVPIAIPTETEIVKDEAPLPLTTPSSSSSFHYDFTQTPTLVESTWPQSSLRENETKFLSISIGNTHLKWAFHGGKSRDDWTPYYNWVTPHVNSKDLETTENKVEELLKYFWNTVKTFIFGGDETYQGAVNEAKARGHEMSFYIVSTHDESCQNLAQLLACIPCRIIRLKPNDFYSEKEGRYPTMGVDRVANMLGAKCLFGAPNLIVDCGTSLTYTASDCKGNIIGGGIAPGMKMRLDSLGEKTCKLPTITMKEVEQRVKAAECNKSPIPIFATNTEDAIIGNLLGEVSSSVRTIRERWIEEVGTLSGDTIKPKTISDISLMTEMFNDISNHIIDIQSQRAVILTGGASSTLSKVLNQNILVCSKSTSPPCPSVHMVSLIHFGVAYALLKNSRPHTEYIGMRVANSTDTKGDTVIRGSVKWVNKDETFLIQYDDAGQENVTMDKLLSLKKVYDLVGEDRVGNHSHTPSKKQQSKGASSGKDSSGKKRGKSSISSDILKTSTPKKKQKVTPTHISTSRSTPVKAENSGSASKPLVKKDPNHFISKRVAKYFGDELFFGTVTRYNGKYWHISYDDGDNEDMNVKELHQFLKLYTEESVKDIQEK